MADGSPHDDGTANAPGAGGTSLALRRWSQALPDSIVERSSVRGVVRSRVARTTLQGLTAAASLPLVAGTTMLALTSDHLERPVAAAVYWSYLIAVSMAVGLYWWRERPASRFGPLLVTFGLLTWVVSWQGANAALPFDIGVLAEGPFFVLTFYLFLAFPMGHLEPRAARWLMGALTIGVVAFFLPWALFTPVIAGGGPLTRCVPSCPPNVLQLGSAPTVVKVAGDAETYAALAITVAVLFVYAWRVRVATRPQRRALIAVAVTSLLFLPAYFVFNFAAWILKLDTSTLDALAWGIVGARVLLPLGFLLALLQAAAFATTAQRRLLERLVSRPTPEQWRDEVAGALDDPSLGLGYRDPAVGVFRKADGTPLEPSADAHRAWVPIERDGHPVAAMVVDETLAEDPELVRAATAATLLAVENGALEGELRASRERMLSAGTAERRRIERDLHDSAQQRLIALRIHLALLGERLDRSGERAMLEKLGGELEEAIDELRDVAHGVYPRLVADAGLGTALKAIADRSAMRLAVVDDRPGRHSEALETAVYFCCLECLQNAAKHAGRDASVTVRLSERDGRLAFSVADDGVGFDPATVERGEGLTNLAERVSALGGALSVDSRPGGGTRVGGELPAF